MSKQDIKTLMNKYEYAEILQLAVLEIQRARTTIARQVNSTTNSVYWNLGKLLFEKQLVEGYGSGVVKQLSVDMKIEFPDMGLSPRNLWNMKRFYERYYQADTKLLQAVAVLPWGHNLLLLDKVQPLKNVLFYGSNWDQAPFILSRTMSESIMGTDPLSIWTAIHLFSDTYNGPFFGTFHKEYELPWPFKF